MLAGSFINPLNLPNLLTPFRYNLEIQYIVFSILFVSLLGYVLFAFLDYITGIDKMLILLGVFVILLFLFLVIKERDRLDEYTLQEETVNMQKELAEIDRDIKLKDVLRKEALNGVIYDENNNRIETGKADLAKVKNYQTEINRLKTRKKELQDKESSYDRLYLDEAKEFVKGSTESESNKLIRDNEILAQGIDRISGQSSEKLDQLLKERQELDDEFYAKTSKDRFNKDISKDYKTKINNKLQQIANEKNRLAEKNLSARERVELDRKRKKLEENVKRQQQLGGLFDRKDNYLLNQKEISDYDNEEREKKQKLRDINKKIGKFQEQNEGREKTKNYRDQEDNLFKEKEDAERQLNKFRSDNKEQIDNLKRLNRGNEGIMKSKETIDLYDNIADTGSNSARSRQLGAYQKLDKKLEEADAAGNISKAAADVNNAFKAGTSEEKRLELLTDAFSLQLPDKDRSYIKRELKKSFQYGKSNNQSEEFRALAAFAQLKNPKAPPITDASINNALNNPQGQDIGKKDVFKIITTSQPALGLQGGGTINNIGDAGEIFEDERRLRRSGDKAFRETSNEFISPRERRLRDRLQEEIYDGDEMKTKFKNSAKSKREAFEANLEQYDRLRLGGSLADGQGPLVGPRLPDGRIIQNQGAPPPEDIKSLARQLKDQVEENTDEGFYPREERGQLLTRLNNTINS